MMSPRVTTGKGGSLGCTVSKLDVSPGRQTFRRGDGLRNFTHRGQPLSERGSLLDTPVGQQQALGDVVLKPMSLPSQGQLLGAQTEIPMQGMKVLVG